MSSIFEAGTFDINKDEQQIKIKKLTQNYRIEFNVEVLERPQVLSVTPTNSPDGTYRDSTIQVMFDHAVDEDSIYFTPTDIAELKVKNNLTDSDFISTIVHGNQKYYAYRYNNQLFYKNITIQDYKTGANIIENFGIPYFDGNTILLIPTNDNNLPTPGTFVFVTILSDFYYTDSSKPITLTKHVTMPEPKKWDYLVNSRVDSAPPTFNTNQFIFKRKLNNGTYEDMTNKTNDNIQFTTQEELLNNFTLLNDLKLAISISDNYGSGPKSITYKIHNLDTDTYTDNITLDITIIGTEAGFGTYDNDNLQPLSLDLSNLSGITLNGTNTIQFTGTDQKNNSLSSEYYYFYVDADAPKFDINNPPQITLDSSLNSNFLISWQNPQDLDFDKVVIEYKEKDSTTPATIINDIERTATSKILELENGKTYDIKVYPTDIFGNKENVDSIYKNTAPGTIQNLITNINENSQNAITISWTKSNGNYKGANIYWSNTADFTPNPLDENHKVTVIATENTLNYTYTLASLVQGSKYYFKLCAYDEFNISNYISDNGIIVLPANVTNLLAQKDENSPSNQINLSWTNPVDNYTGLKIYKKTRNETSYPSTPDYIITDGSTSKSFTGLTGGTIYDFNIVSYINIDNQEITSDNNIISCNTYINNASNFTTENTNNSTNSIVLNWTNPVGNFTGVKIYKKEINSEYDSTYINITDHSSTYVYEGLAGGKKYVFKLVPYINIDNQDFTATELEQSAITYPNSIQNINSISADNTTNTIKLNWTNPTDKFDGIKAYYKLSEDPYSNYQQFTTITDTTPSKNMNETYPGFAAGTQYEFKFVPYVNFDNTDYLAVGKTTITNTIPNNVTEFSISKNITTPTTQIDLNWTNPTGSYTFIRIYKKLHDSQDSYEQIAMISDLITTSYTVQNLDIASYYDFKVETVKQFNNGSDTISSEITSSYATSPESVTDFTANHNSSKELYLTWTNPSSNFDGNIIYVKLNGDWNKLKDLQNKNNNITFNDLAAGKIYEFKITPYIKIDENYYYANEATVTSFSYPNSVKDLTSTRDSTNPSSSINLSWTQLNGNADGIKIYYSTNDNTYTEITTSGNIKLASAITSSSTSCKIINLNGGTKYYFKVQPFIFFNSNYKYAESKTTSQTALNNITDFVASRNSDNPSTKINLSWTNPQGNFTGNTVYYKLSSDSTWTTYDNITANNITISGLIDNKEYNFKVVPYILDGSTKNTYENPTIITSYTAPSPVTKFSSSNITGYEASEIKLTWNNPSYTPLPNRIIKFKKQSDEVYKTITLDNNAVEYIIHDHNKVSYQDAQLTYEELDAGTTYNIQIMTVNNGIESTIQELNHTTAPKSLGLEIIEEEAQTEQTSFKIWIKKYGSVDKLSTITENYDGVRLYYKESTATKYNLKKQWTKEEFLAAEDASSATSGFTYDFTDLSQGTTYKLKIVSYVNNGDNSSLESPEPILLSPALISIRTIGDLTISGIIGTKITNTSGSVSKLKLEWTPPSDIPSNWTYNIYAYSSEFEDWVYVVSSSESNVEIKISDLKSLKVVSNTLISHGTVIKFKIGFERYGLDNATEYDFIY